MTDINPDAVQRGVEATLTELLTAGRHPFSAEPIYDAVAEGTRRAFAEHLADQRDDAKPSAPAARPTTEVLREWRTSDVWCPYHEKLVTSGDLCEARLDQEMWPVTVVHQVIRKPGADA